VQHATCQKLLVIALGPGQGPMDEIYCNIGVDPLRGGYFATRPQAMRAPPPPNALGVSE
jgi:hypothetical protein